MKLKHVAEGSFDYKGKLATYNQYVDETGTIIKIEAIYDNKTFEYERNQKVNFQEDFENNLKKYFG